MEHPYLSSFYDSKDIVRSKNKIKVPIDDNQRLSLKEYRNIIYEEIRKKNQSEVEFNTTTLYRIKQSVRKRDPLLKNNHQLQSCVKTEDFKDRLDSESKNSRSKKETVLLKTKKNLRTIEREWNPM